ncbi:MAG: bL21 family ribosomal protein [Candidatus Atribacteria bacterium]|nr:bL21 family ribosomal protein [Candidatus Atribacteria bacterium]
MSSGLILVFKYKPKVKYRKSLGHRQNMTLVKIQSLG